MSDLNVPVPLRTFRGSRNGYSWLNSDERKGKSSQAFISPSISKKIFAKQCRASPVTSLASLFVFFTKMVGEFLRGRGKIRNEISRVGREEKEKCRNASKTSPLQLPSSILSLRSHPRFPFFNVISQASDPAGFRFPFLFRAHSPRCFPVTCRHSADPSKIYPSTNVPFRFSICPVQRILPPGNTDDENRASPRRNSLSLSIYLSSLFLSL